jgi:hypothetical protein
MARPARVRIRRRKPCFLCRRRLFGWNVRLLTGMTPVTRDHDVDKSTGRSVLGASCLPLEKPGSSGSAARNGRFNTDRSTVRGRLWTGQTSRPHSFPQPCGRIMSGGRCHTATETATQCDWLTMITL